MRRLGTGPLLAGVFLGTASLYFVSLAAGIPALRVAAKPFPALALAAWVTLRSTRLAGRLTALGLVLSAAGDLLLETDRFLPGLVAFLAGHLAYVAAFLAAERRPAFARALPFLAWGLGAFSLLRPGLGDLTLPVALYVAVICTMMWRASARIGSPATPALAALLGLFGAVAFGASDTLLAFDRFSAPVPAARWAIMVLYWLGQCGLAASAVLGCDMLREKVENR